MKSKRDEENYGTGFDDGLEPLVPLDVGRLDDAIAPRGLGGQLETEAVDQANRLVHFRAICDTNLEVDARPGPRPPCSDDPGPGS